MAKINIQFNNTTYAIDESELAPSIDELKTHLSTVINGSGAVINIDDTDYDIDATKLSTATSDFVAYLGTISGTGSKVVIDGVEYSIDATKIQNAVSEVQTTLDNMGEIEERLEGDGSEFHAFAPASLSFRATAPLDSLQEIQIDGQTVDPSNYTLTEGSTIVTFPIDYLKTLEDGNYEISVVSEGQSARGEFSVVVPESNEYDFYYNQPYTAYVEMFGTNYTFFLRADGTVDVMDTSADFPTTCTYTLDGNNITFDTPMGVFTGSIGSDGLYCNEFATMFVLGNELVVADEDYIYMYSASLGGYEVIAIDRTKTSYGAIKTGIYGYDTVALRSHAFFRCCNFTNITIPDSITSIGRYAFEQCDRLESIIIPDSVTTLDNCAISECYALTNLVIGNSVVNIDGVISGCSALTTVVIGNAVKTIPSHMFSDLPLTSITIGNSVEHIGDSAFFACRSLTDVIIPDSVTSIGDQAFSDCENLKNITVGDNVVSIGKKAFYQCNSLINITIPDSVTSIGKYVFDHCENLESVALGNSVITIEDYAFSHCHNLNSINIPHSVTSIGQWAFNQCEKLTSVTIPSSVKTINYAAFAWCSGLENITFNGTVQQWTNEVVKEDYWHNDVPATYVQCSDGQVAL